MKHLTLIARFLLALLLMTAGLTCWAAAGIADDLATRHGRSAMLQDAAAPQSGRWREALEGVLDTSVADADYWAGRYDVLTAGRAVNDADPAQLLIAANAMFRKAERDGARTTGVERLDQVLQAYTSALKNGGFNGDAAYNYELVSRLRDNLARSKPGASPRQPSSPAAAKRDELPAGPTIHGRPGTHPPNTRGDEFEVLTPMDYGDREAQPEPTPGRPLPRKG